ncbi:MAG: apolipoprotein N-acyltransferase [Planctomycetota bacterium]|nr:MAG: apolipoprotein N-acyltransferase [Planctomycetota bacterium]
MIQLPFKPNGFYSILISIILILLCIPPFNFWFLAFLVLIPVFFTIHQQTYKQVFFTGTLFGFLFYLGIFYWVIPSVSSVSGIHIIFSSLICLTAFFLIGIAYGGLFLLIKFSLHNSLYLTPFLFPAFEFLILPVFPIGIGYVWGDSLLGAQAADIGGIYFLSFITNLYGFIVLLIITKKSSTKKGLSCLAVLLFIHFGYGYTRYVTITKMDSTDAIKIMIVQPAISPIQKRDETEKTYIEVMTQLIKAIEQNKDIDLIILPESIFVPTMADKDVRLDAFKKVLTSQQAICWGCNTRQDEKYFNSIGFIDNSSKAKWKYYQKQNLLLIGEYIPYINNFPALKKSIEKITQINHFSPGEKLVSFEKKSFTILPSICFENMFSIKMAKKLNQIKGADILLNISEDGWFGDTNAQPIHYFVTKLRAIEFRRPLVRSLNVGISAVVDERGVEISKIKNNSGELTDLTRTNSFEKSIVICEIKKKSSFSFYGYIGYFFPYICSVILLFLLGQGLIRFNKNRRNKSPTNTDNQ